MCARISWSHSAFESTLNSSIIYRTQSETPCNGLSRDLHLKRFDFRKSLEHLHLGLKATSLVSGISLSCDFTSYKFLCTTHWAYTNQKASKTVVVIANISHLCWCSRFLTLINEIVKFLYNYSTAKMHRQSLRYFYVEMAYFCGLFGAKFYFSPWPKPTTLNPSIVSYHIVEHWNCCQWSVSRPRWPVGVYDCCVAGYVDWVFSVTRRLSSIHYFSTTSTLPLVSHSLTHH